MHLHLHAHRQAVGEDPVGQFAEGQQYAEGQQHAESQFADAVYGTVLAQDNGML